MVRGKGRDREIGTTVDSATEEVGEEEVVGRIIIEVRSEVETTGTGAQRWATTTTEEEEVEEEVESRTVVRPSKKTGRSPPTSTTTWTSMPPR
jgi:hypothetical protein